MCESIRLVCTCEHCNLGIGVGGLVNQVFDDIGDGGEGGEGDGDGRGKGKKLSLHICSMRDAS